MRTVLVKFLAIAIFCGIAYFGLEIVGITPPPMWWYTAIVEQDTSYFQAAPEAPSDDLLGWLVFPPDALDMPLSEHSRIRRPVFRRGDDVFIHLWHGHDDSVGMAVSDDPDFKTNVEKLVSILHIDHLKGRLYRWSINPERNNEHYPIDGR